MLRLLTILCGLVWAATESKAQDMQNTKAASTVYDKAYFQKQLAALEQLQPCNADAVAPDLHLVLDRTEAQAHGKPGVLLKQVLRTDEVLQMAFEDRLTADDLAWLRAMAVKKPARKTSGSAKAFAPKCQGAASAMLPFAQLSSLINDLVIESPPGPQQPELTEDCILKLNAKALHEDYFHAQTLYIGNLVDYKTPSGPGVSLTAWYLQHIDPEHQWRLFRVRLIMRYAAGQLQRAAVHIVPIDGKYHGNLEHLSTLSWTDGKCRIVNIGLTPDENEGEGYFLQQQIWEEE